jgi:hypothetical protein
MSMLFRFAKSRMVIPAGAVTSLPFSLTVISAIYTSTRIKNIEYRTKKKEETKSMSDF